MTDALYFDGQSTRAQPVTVLLHKRVVAIHGDGIRRSLRLSQLVVSEPLERAPRILRLPDGATVEVSDPAFDRLLLANGYVEHWVVRWQQNWGLALGALFTLLVLLASAYQWGLPWAADVVAQHLPATLEKKIGDAQMQLVEARFLTPSRLDLVDQQRIQTLFGALKRPAGDHASYRLIFRHSEVGPNAFAMPNGVIVMTDQLTMLARDDQAVLGVLAHELGHLQRRHTLRRLLQGASVGIFLNLFIGDVSTMLAALPTVLIDQKYSRDFEREADQYAITVLQANAVPLAPLAALFEKMRSSQTLNSDRRGTQKPAAPTRASSYFSSHPSDEERIARLRAADHP
ncbi:Zn-dependent protease with chaperone function [Actimicrobium sp. GrIS 1.19]|uniref:M48 family metallopeptidase n=1 Tax=Actimicrobium sp. GrIS 1.19 TaxID=3071708 RepID=UPI002DFC26D5|nr:Zn-dependent protease with chaperone function [Actimicrobium sp. GrIS 1.19]